MHAFAPMYVHAFSALAEGCIVCAIQAHAAVDAAVRARIHMGQELTKEEAAVG